MSSSSARATLATPTATGSNHHRPPPLSSATIKGASAVPVPSTVCRAVTAVSPRLGKKPAAYALIAVSVAPEPIPKSPVAASSVA